MGRTIGWNVRQTMADRRSWAIYRMLPGMTSESWQALTPAANTGFIRWIPMGKMPFRRGTIAMEIRLAAKYIMQSLILSHLKMFRKCICNHWSFVSNTFHESESIIHGFLNGQMNKETGDCHEKDLCVMIFYQRRL